MSTNGQTDFSKSVMKHDKQEDGLLKLINGL